jgi:hypothetical protein
VPRLTTLLALMACASLAGAGFSPAQTVPAQPAASTGLVVGVVVDAVSGKAIPDAVVTIALRTTGGAPAPTIANVPQRVMTDPTGRFAFTGLPAAGFVLRATKAGYAAPDNSLRLDPAGGMADLDLRDGERVTNASLSLSKYAAISGRVTDDLGDPVVGVTVRAHRRVFEAGHPRFDYGDRATVRTDDRGIYRIATLSPGEYVVAVPAIQVTWPAAVVTDYMTTGGAGNLGPLLDTLGMATVNAMGNPRPPMGTMGAQKVGNLVLQSPSGAYYPPDPADPSRAMAYQTTFAPSATIATAATVVTVHAGEERAGVDVALRLVPTVTVSGTVTGPDGAVPLAALRLMTPSSALPDSADFASASALSDASGAFTFLNVPAGQYVLRASKRPSAGQKLPETYKLWAEESLTVGTTPIDGVTVTLQRPFTVTGRVEFEGASPPPSSQELLRPPQPLLLLMTADASTAFFVLVDANGAFASGPVAGGRYLLTSRTTIGPWSLKSAMSQAIDATRTPIELRDGDVTGVVATFTDRPATIAGTVRNAQGTPDKHVTVLLFPAEPAAWAGDGYRPRQFISVITTLAGAYVFPRVPAGDYFLVAATDKVDANTAPTIIDLPGSLREWQNPAFLAALSRTAVRVQVADGQAQTQDLKATVIR